MNRIAVAAATVAAGLVVAGAALAVAGRPGPPAAGARPHMAAGAAAAQHFIAMMVPHHEDAVAMAQLAQTHAEHARVRALAVGIERTQSAEIAQMQAWYRAWYGEAVPALPRRGRPVDADDLADAEPFDQAFLAEMIRHHAMGVRMISMLLPRVDRPELARLMREMAATQRREIAAMRGWYADWYGTAPPPAFGNGMGPGHGHGMGYGMRR